MFYQNSVVLTLQIAILFPQSPFLLKYSCRCTVAVHAELKT